MATDEFDRLFKVLEVENHASLQEIKKAYLYLKELYSTQSLAISPLDNELDENRRQQILQEIENAFFTLRDHLSDRDQLRKEVADEIGVAKEPSSSPASVNGSYLREVREKMGVKLHEISYFTKIALGTLENIESERFEHFQSEVYLKMNLRSYLKYLTIETEPTINEYCKNYRAWKKSLKKTY